QRRGRAIVLDEAPALPRQLRRGGEGAATPGLAVAPFRGPWRSPLKLRPPRAAPRDERPHPDRRHPPPPPRPNGHPTTSSHASDLLACQSVPSAITDEHGRNGLIQDARRDPPGA